MKDIPGYEAYCATEDGQIYSKVSKKFLKQFVRDKFGYYGVNIYIGEGKGFGRTGFKGIAVHTLILYAFMGPKPEGQHCCHIDGNPKNNRVSNLKWGTVKENMGHKITHGTIANGARNGNSKITESDVIFLRESFRRYSPKKSNIKELSEKVGLHPEIVRKIILGESWKHVPGAIPKGFIHGNKAPT